MNQTEQILAKSLEPAVNFHALKSKGLKYIEELAGEMWTNFNDSDPGVTILEQLCYALTELGYCNNFAIEDILAEKTGRIEYQGQFFTPQQSLTSSPITITDYRKLLVDQVNELSNVHLSAEPKTARYGVWLYPGHNTYLELNELYQFIDKLISPNNMKAEVFYTQIGYVCDGLVELIDCLVVPDSDTKIQSKLDKLDKIFANETAEVNWGGSAQVNFQVVRALAVKFQAMLSQANICLNQHRNMAELFYYPAIFIPKTITLKGQIHLQPGTTIEQIQQKLVLSLESYAIGQVQQAGYQDSVNKEQQASEIFNGPELQHGWIANEDLGNKLDNISLLEVTALVSCLPEVAAIIQPELFVAEHGNSQNHHVIDIGQQQVARFNIECQYIQPDSIAQSYQHNANVINLKQLQQKQKNQPINAKLDRVPALPQGKFKDIETYYSVQNTFPPIFGIGEDSLPDTVSENRLAQAKQLKGYLMVFDQLIANQFSQLANTAELLSFNPVSTLAEAPKKFKGIPTQLLPPTYYCQPLYEVPNAHTLLKGHDSYNYGFSDESDRATQEKVKHKFQHDPFNQYMIGLRSCMEDDIELSHRRNQVLDHLLARHGCSGALFNQLIIRIRWYADLTKTQVIVKTLILQNWQKLSYYRNKAYNFEQAAPQLPLELSWKYWLLKQQRFQSWLVEILTPFYSRYFNDLASFKNALYSQLKQNIEKIKKQVSHGNIKQQLTLLREVLLTNTAVINFRPQLDIYINGQVDLEKLSKAEALSVQDFCNYSTFELFTNLILGLVDHYRLLIDTLCSLLAQEGFTNWLKNKKEQSRFSSDKNGQVNSIISTKLGDVVYISEQPVMTITGRNDQPTCYQVYIEHLQQLIWISQQRKGMLLLELSLIEAFSNQSSSQALEKQLEPLVDELKQNNQTVENKLTCLSIFPSYIHLFQPISHDTNTSQFNSAWQKLLENYWPRHVRNHQCFASFGILQQLIPCFVDWQNQIRGQSVSLALIPSSSQSKESAATSSQGGAYDS